MGLRWAQKNVSPIGIDFGADSLKLLQVVNEDPPQLVAAAQRDVPADVRKHADPYYRYAGDALREMVREAGVKTRRVVASISAAQMYVQHVRLASSDPQTTQQQVEMELRGRLPLDPTNMVVRHVEVGQVFADGTSKQEMICFAASRESVMRSVRAIRAAGLDVVGMHGEPMAILASFSHLFRRAGDEKRTTLFIDIGGATTKALIAHGKQLVFAKTIHVAGDHFSRQMALAWDVDVAEARHRRIQQAADAAEASEAAAATEQQRSEDGSDIRVAADAQAAERRQGAPVPGMAALNASMAAGGEGEDESAVPASGPPHAPAEPRRTAPAQMQAQARMQTRPSASTPDGGGEGEMLEALIDELQLCAGYHASMFPERPIEKVVFLGGESRHAGMCQRIARAMRLPAQRADPMARLVKRSTVSPLGVDLRQPQPGWAVPVGLCRLPTNL